MCLAIFMYLVTGVLSLVSQFLLAFGIFTLTLLGKTILFICTFIYTVARPFRREFEELPPEIPFETMYSEFQDFEKDYDAMAKMSLETVSSTGSHRARKDKLKNSPLDLNIKSRKRRKIVMKLTKSYFSFFNKLVITF